MPTKLQTIASPALKVPPHDLGAEQAVLGSILIKPDVIHDIAAFLLEEDFYFGKHRIIYAAMRALMDKHEPIDVISVTSHLRENKMLETAGGASYLAELINVVPTATNAEHYADIVKKKSTLRRLIDSASRILDLGYDGQGDLDDIFEQAERLVFNISETAKRTIVNIKDTLQEAWERFEHLHQSTDELRGISSGFKPLDNLLAGFQKSDLIILAARPSMGKTTFALDIARHVACRLKVPTLIFSLEMSSQQLVDRVLAAESRVNSWRLRTGKITADEDFARIRDALDSLSQAPIFIDDESSNNITKMRSVARRVKSEHGLGLIIVDYLQLMIPKKETDSMVQQVTEISRSLKGLARELEVPVIALSQLSRAVEQRGGKPRLSDLRDSGSIEQDADVVMFIHREDKYNEASDRKNIAEILVEKHRNGPVGKIELYFDENQVSFFPIEKSDFGGF